MPVVISMLRAVNVGGHCKIGMEDLKALYKSLGLREAQTYIQSGNVIFRTEQRDLVPLAKRIGNRIERSFGFRPEVIVRSASELRDVIAGNPFATRRDIVPGKLLVTFLASDPGEEAREGVLRIKVSPEELRIHGRELYIHFPNGAGRSKLPVALINKTLKTPGTARNWNTVTKLMGMVAKMEASS